MAARSSAVPGRAKKRRVNVGSQDIRALMETSFVWDNHTCMPLRLNDEFLPQLQRAKASGFDVIGLNVGFGQMDAASHLKQLAYFRHWIRQHDDEFTLVGKVDDIKAAKLAGKLGVFFDIEGANALDERVELVELYYDLGVRWMLLVYNMRNPVGSGCQDTEDRGLTPFGRDVIREMERVGMLVCCTHTGYRTARETLEFASRPVIFSHSNPRTLVDHPRNIADELIRACAATGGVVGINGVGLFLGDNDISPDNLVRHIDHVAQLVGPEHVGLGLDYVYDMAEIIEYVHKNPEQFPAHLGYADGVKFAPPEILEGIVEALFRKGYETEHVRDILGGNFLRLARQAWQ
jgi:membrane dipeptidase